jgi:hypothetical protein
VDAGYTACERCRPAGADVRGVAADEPAGTGRQTERGAEATETASAPVVLVRRHFHRPGCRYVGVASERRETTKAVARAEGALPCGVCRP